MTPDSRVGEPVDALTVACLLLELAFVAVVLAAGVAGAALRGGRR
jgi:nucleoside phosphorylase